MEKILTVGVCVRNCELTVGDAVRSIIDQDFPKDEMENINKSFDLYKKIL